MNLKRTEEKQLCAARMVGDGLPMEEVGRQLGVCRRTVLRWLTDPAARAEVAKWKRVREERFGRNVRRKLKVLRAQMEREHQARIARIRLSMGFLL